MAKPSSDNGTSKLDFGTGELEVQGFVKEVKVDSGSSSLYNLEEDGVKLRSLFDGRLEYTGRISGKQYTWNKAGSIILVDSADASYLLEKRIGKQACCGDSKDGSALFEQVK